MIPFPTTCTASFTLDRPAHEALALFTAEGERAWAPGWEPEILSGGLQRGSVFRTVAQGRETVWIVTEYEPQQGRASYARIAQGSNMGLVDVRCSAAGPEASRISVTYTLTGLGPEGRSFVDGFLEEARYRGFIDEWREALTAYLGPGQPPTP